jgi:class 3 adenylate cyclase
MPKPSQRRLAAIMFTDIVGYSAMMQKNEALGARLRARHREVFQQLHEKYGGEIIQYFGDGTLSVFASTADAVECAVEMQKALKQAPQVPIRIGIHTGDIMFRDEDVIGDGVNIAARIQSQCVPGGVFISGKAYDDIKNYPELGARPVGQSNLKNIQEPVDLYTITNAGVTVPDYEWAPQQLFQAAPAPKGPPKTRKKKWVAAMLAFFFGIFGLHRFYLEQRKLGIAYLSMFFLGAFILPNADQLVAIPALLGFVDFLIFLSSSRANFDERYNKEVLTANQQQQQKARARASDPKAQLLKQRRKYLEEALAAHREYEYEEAIAATVKAIEIKYDDPKVHYFIARCYSLLEQADKALEHLDIAVALGFQPLERIRTEGDFAFLRIQPEYRTFEQNDFQLVRSDTAPQTETLDLQEPDAPDLLVQLSKLEKERLSGRLSQEEYQQREKELKARRIDED